MSPVNVLLIDGAAKDGRAPTGELQLNYEGVTFSLLLLLLLLFLFLFLHATVLESVRPNRRLMQGEFLVWLFW